ncbi:hypothetical protein HZA40_03590 [Candidatus Peregrinibacteria bacterium]|nr:hypothetical protein [Candidatus Peregrinibacteria bacterium]
MKFLRNFAFWLITFCFAFLQVQFLAFAAETYGTVLPETKSSVQTCESLMNEVSKNSCWVIQHIFKNNDNKCNASTIKVEIAEDTAISEVLACGIKTGSIHLWMIPYYIKYILQFIIGIAGLVAVGGIVYGGYLYLFAGVSSEKDKGKKAIQYGIIGMVMTLVAWAFVNIIISLFTG